MQEVEKFKVHYASRDKGMQNLLRAWLLQLTEIKNKGCLSVLAGRSNCIYSEKEAGGKKGFKMTNGFILW